MKVGCGVNIGAELKFVASHFYELNERELGGVTPDLLEAVLSHSDLLLIDEDSLLNFILSREEEFSALLGYVECQFLSVSSIDQFLSKVTKENVDSVIWSSICRRLQWESVDDKANCGRFASIKYEEFVVTKGQEFNGILNELTKKCGGNVHEKGIVNITSSGDAYNKCWQLVNHGWTDSYISQNTTSPWVCFDFKDSQIAVRSYSVKSALGRMRFPVSWVIEGSNDQYEWVIIDQRHTKELVGSGMVKNFPCPGGHLPEFFRFVRIRQIGRNSSDDDYLILTGIEFFGVVK
jgi:hypothetical protein